mgnify:CR=1 FL=1
MRTVKGKTPIAVHGALLAVSLLFGANYVVAKFALREITPSGLVVIRAWGTAVILFGTSGLLRSSKPREPIRPSEFGQLFLYSLLGVSINQLCFLAGLDRSTATNASIMLVSIPVLTHAFAVLLGRERPSIAAGAGRAPSVKNERRSSTASKSTRSTSPELTCPVAIRFDSGCTRCLSMARFRCRAPYFKSVPSRSR